MLELKTISREAIPSALNKAERYRLLNEPREAESICQDVLAIDPENEEALVTLLLALTDQFGTGEHLPFEEAKRLLPLLRREYDRKYYEGVILERWGKSHIGGPMPTAVVHEWLRAAMRCYDEAEGIRPELNDDSILRWNACARMIQRQGPSEPGVHGDPHELLDEDVPPR